MKGSLTLQTHIDGQWLDALSMTMADAKNVAASRCSLAYSPPYLIDFANQLESQGNLAVSVNRPLTWDLSDTKGYPPFVYDMLPAGAARKYLLKRFASEEPDWMDLDFFLLSRHTSSPIGHMRVKESVERVDPTYHEAFRRQDVIARTHDFFEYAYESGAAFVGATGAQGEAPKLIMAEDEHGEVYADAMLADEQAKRHWLVKFARNQVTERDKNILRAEYHYYKAVSVLGIDTVSVDGLALEEAERPSLWMPRFDRSVVEGKVERIAVESIYSVCGNTTPGSGMNHEDVIRRLVSLWTDNGQQQEHDELIFEYVRRDLLNRVLGNSDNHGRNMAILKRNGAFALAPVYDLAPMVLDPEGVTRVTKWASERKGNPDWKAVCESFVGLTNTTDLYDRLRDAAEAFRALPDLLTALPDEVRQARSIPLNALDRHLAEWGLR